MTTEEHDAFNLGREAAAAAASWAADGRTDNDWARHALAMLADGDPEVWDYLPERPNLSGEWATERTPASLAREVLGWDASLTPDEIDALAEAYEAGVDAEFEEACEAELLRFLGGDR